MTKITYICCDVVMMYLIYYRITLTSLFDSLFLNSFVALLFLAAVHAAEREPQPLRMHRNPMRCLRRFPPVMLRQKHQRLTNTCGSSVTGEHMTDCVSLFRFFVFFQSKIQSSPSAFHINALCCCSSRQSRKPLFWISPTHPGQTPSLTVIHYLEQTVDSVINGKSSDFYLSDEECAASMFYELK